MKTLTLLRHAKSGWDDTVQRDFDRPLNAKGQRVALAVGRALKTRGATFDRVVASSAARVVETLDQVGRGYGAALEPVWDRRLYLATPETMIDVVHEQDAGCDRLLIVGHNPGLEQLALDLSGAGSDATLLAAVEAKFPTASVAVLTFPGDDWRVVQPGAGTLVSFVRPRDLDPAFGPDRD
ncbi:SixA phosphatase family protein [Sphingomonas sp. RS2018]